MSCDPNRKYNIICDLETISLTIGPQRTAIIRISVATGDRVGQLNQAILNQIPAIFRNDLFNFQRWLHSVACTQTKENLANLQNMGVQVSFEEPVTLNIQLDECQLEQLFVEWKVGQFGLYSPVKGLQEISQTRQMTKKRPLETILLEEEEYEPEMLLLDLPSMLSLDEPEMPSLNEPEIRQKKEKPIEIIEPPLKRAKVKVQPGVQVDFTALSESEQILILNLLQFDIQALTRLCMTNPQIYQYCQSMEFWEPCGFTRDCHFKGIIERNQLQSLKKQRGVCPQDYLLMATAQGYSNLVGILLEAGADPNLRTGHAQTVLNLALLKGFDDIVEKLLQYGVIPSIFEINTTVKRNGPQLLVSVLNNFGTPHAIRNILPQVLVMASRSGAIDIARILLQEGVDPNIQADDSTPLIEAIKNNQSDIMDVLFEFGADVNAKDWYNVSPLVRAVEEPPEIQEIIPILLQRGADPNAKNYLGDPVLFIAIDNCNLDIIAMLINAGANLSDIDRYGDTPLTAALYNECNWDIIELLLQTDSLLATKPRLTGESPLALAIKAEDDDLIALLKKYTNI